MTYASESAAVPARILADNPRARVIFTLRDPTDRAYSDYRFCFHWFKAVRGRDLAPHRASHRLSHRISLHLIASHCISSYRISSHRIDSHRIESTLIAPHRISSPLISSHRIAHVSHLVKAVSERGRSCAANHRCGPPSRRRALRRLVACRPPPLCVLTLVGGRARHTRPRAATAAPARVLAVVGFATTPPPCLLPAPSRPPRVATPPPSAVPLGRAAPLREQTHVRPDDPRHDRRIPQVLRALRDGRRRRRRRRRAAADDGAGDAGGVGRALLFFLLHAGPVWVAPPEFSGQPAYK